MVERAGEPAGGADSDQANPLIQETIARLNHREREVLLLRFLMRGEFSRRGRAGHFGRGTRKRVARAVQSLRERLHRRGLRWRPRRSWDCWWCMARNLLLLHASEVAASAWASAGEYGACRCGHSRR